MIDGVTRSIPTNKRRLQARSHSRPLGGPLLAAVLLLAQGVAPVRMPAQGAMYRFTRIADSGSLPGVATARCAAVDLSAAVAFVTDDAVWRGDGQALVPVVEADAAGQPLVDPCPGSNGTDTVYAFSAASGYSALVRQGAGGATEVARSDTAPFLALPGSTARHSLSPSGTTLMTGADGQLYVMPAGTPAFVPGASDPALSGIQGATMNDHEVAVFLARRTVNGVTRMGVYRGSGTPLVEAGAAGIADIGANAPAINSSGTVAFVAGWPDGTRRVLSTIDGAAFTDHSGATNLVAGPVSINDSGVVAFAATAASGAPGIFTGPDAIANRVIARGDPLDGSTVVNVALWSHAINRHGHIAFHATLADGRSGVYRADPLLAPTAADGALGTIQNTTTSGSLSASDPLNRPLSFSLVSNGSRGTAVITDASTGMFAYTPASNAIGTDSFTYRASNGDLDSNVATVTVSVAPGPLGNSAPVAEDLGSAPSSAVRFDATGESLTRTTNLPPIGSFTIMGWFRVAATPTGFSSFFAFGPTSTSTSVYRVMRVSGSGGTQHVYLYTGTQGYFVGTLNPVNSWNHLALTVAGSGPQDVRGYLNGQLTVTTAGNPMVVAQKLFIAADGRNMWLNGSAAAVKVYDAPLSPAEIAQEVQQFAPVRTAGLNAFYPMQSAAAAVDDASGLGRPLTASGSLSTDSSGPPVLTALPLETPEDTPVSGVVTASDADGNPLTYAIVGAGTKGVAVITDPATGAFTYTPHPDAAGDDTFTFKANDGLLDSNVASVVVSIAAVNDAPVAADGSVSVTAGGSVSATLAASDVDDTTRTFAIVSNGTRGTATITNAATGAFTYSANAGASGADSFTFRANDGQANSNIATVTVSITAVPNPIATNGSLSAVEDTAAAGTLAATDPNGAPLTFSIITNGSKGSAAITNAVTGAYSYTPAANATGGDSFTFRASNGTYTSNTATIAVTIAAVNDPPVAVNGTASVTAGGSVNGTLSASDIDGPSRAFSIVTNGSKGTAAIADAVTGAFTYTANAGTSGADSFTFRVNDGSDFSNTATVSISITASNPANNAPVATNIGTTPVTAVRFDAAGESLARTAALPPIDSFTVMGWFRVAAATTGYSTFLAFGASSTSTNVYRLMRVTNGSTQNVYLYTGTTGYFVGSLSTGWHHLAFTVSGTGSQSVKGYLDGVERVATSGNPLIAAQKFFIANDGRGMWLNGSSAAVKLYDLALTEAEIAQEMQQMAPARTAGLNGFYPLQTAASATVEAGGLGLALTATGTLTTDPNGPATAAGSGVSTPEDTAFSGTLTATDPDNDLLVYTIVANGTRGTAVLTDPGAGAFTYTPNPNATGIDTFSFMATDGQANSNIATVTLEISPVNDPPVAYDGVASVSAGGSASGALAAADVDGQPLTFTLASNAAKGTVVVTDAATGAYTYTASSGAGGTDAFTFRASDGSASSNVATVTITIGSGPAPTASNSTLSVTEDTQATGTLAASDPAGGALTYSIVTNGTKGLATLTNSATGAFRYVPNPDQTGNDSFTFHAAGASGTSNTATVSVTIAPVNDAPVALNGTTTVMEGSSTTGTLVASDVDNTTRSFTIVTNGGKGTATVTDPSTGTYIYTADAGVSGTDTFTFRANDGSLDSNVGTVTVSITAGAGNNAPVPVSSGGAATSIRFDSQSDELYRTTNLPPATAFTIMGWFRFTGDETVYSSFFRLGHATNSSGYNLLRCCGKGWRQMDMWNGISSKRAVAMTLGTWYHVALTVEGTGPGQMKAYLNGTLVAVHDGNANVPAARLSIGNDAHLEWLDGNGAAVKVYDVPLSALDIQREMPMLQPVRTANLHAWYPLQSRESATADLSGHNRTLLQGGTLATDASGPPIDTGFSTRANTAMNGVLRALDMDGDPLTYSLAGPAAHGTVTVSPNGTFTYTPAGGYTGTDTFTFAVSDGLTSAVGTVTVTVKP